MKSASIVCVAVALAATTAQASVYFEQSRDGSWFARAQGRAVALSGDRLQPAAAFRTPAAGSGLRFEGANPRATGSGESRTGAVSHYLRGNDPSQWRLNVPQFASVRYRSAYPGIDLVYRAAARSIEFDFELAPDVSPQQIRLQFEAPVHVNGAGALVAEGHVLHPPSAWQGDGTGRRRVDVAFATLDSKRVGFRLGAYDPKLPLVIDPVLEFATYLGGSDTESGTRIATGQDGAIFVAGTTLSADFPAAMPESSPLNRPVSMFAADAFVTRLKPDGSAQD